jgi:putative FmdB family regulatory protein
LTLPGASDNLEGDFPSLSTTMPTYEYHCSACGHDFSRTESVAAHEKAKVACPNCRSSKVERTFTPFYAKTGRKS